METCTGTPTLVNLRRRNPLWAGNMIREKIARRFNMGEGGARQVSDLVMPPDYKLKHDYYKTQPYVLLRQETQNGEQGFVCAPVTVYNNVDAENEVFISTLDLSGLPGASMPLLNWSYGGTNIINTSVEDYLKRGGTSALAAAVASRIYGDAVQRMHTDTYKKTAPVLMNIAAMHQQTAIALYKLENTARN